jgi:hypothetical protein
MSILGNLARAVVGTVTLPVSAVADVVTLGGVLSEKRTTYTVDRVRDIMAALDKAAREDA